MTTEDLYPKSMYFDIWEVHLLRVYESLNLTIAYAGIPKTQYLIVIFYVGVFNIT